MKTNSLRKLRLGLTTNVATDSRAVMLQFDDGGEDFIILAPDEARRMSATLIEMANKADEINEKRLET